LAIREIARSSDRKKSGIFVTFSLADFRFIR
jgi:hypothetical protein